MKNKKSNIRPNPLVAFVITKKEYEVLERISARSGVSIAHVARGFMRMGWKDVKLPDIAKLEVLHSGRL